MHDQQHIEREHDGGRYRSGGHREKPARTGTHNVAAPRQDQQSDHWDRQDQAQRDLAQDERPGSINAGRHDDNAGTIVTSRRSQSGMRYWVKPCMMTCPAIVPTAELDSPDAINETRKTPQRRTPAPVSKYDRRY